MRGEIPQTIDVSFSGFHGETDIEMVEGGPVANEVAVEIRKPGEFCGVFGVFDPDSDINPAITAHTGLLALQHRGQEEAGIATSDGLKVKKPETGPGKIDNVFPNSARLRRIAKHAILAAGHVRYSTITIEGDGAQPYRDPGKEFTFSHNGNVNEIEGYDLSSATCSDSKSMADVLHEARVEAPADETFIETFMQTLPRFKGAYSLVVTTKDSLIGARDPNGFRPLHLGRTISGGYVLSSETSAFDANKRIEYVREVKPGEVIKIDAYGFRSYFPFPAEKVNEKFCIFELVYFSAPASLHKEKQISVMRREMGANLARRDRELHPDLNIDVVIGVPDSGIEAAVGYAREAGVFYDPGMQKNRYVGRTFISQAKQFNEEDPSEETEPSHRKPQAPTIDSRGNGVFAKLNPYLNVVKDQDVLVVDDSIVRGNTTKALVEMLRLAGARSVHLRISSPPYRWPCFYGMDTGDPEQLIAHQTNGNTDLIREYVNADTLEYLTPEGLAAAVTGEKCSDIETMEGFCTACTTGMYPPDTGVTKKLVKLDEKLFS